MFREQEHLNGGHEKKGEKGSVLSEHGAHDRELDLV